ncbi:unnamed protein product, partial [marine sediment metagenome]
LKIDGILGAKTQDAWESFANSNDLTFTKDPEMFMKVMEIVPIKKGVIR